MNENTIERIGMALADRAYAYRLFHVALGAEPNAEELDVLASEQTRAVFDRLAGSDVAKAKRLATWDEGLKVDSTCSDALTRMVELCAVLGERRANDPAYADAMKVAFNKLFMVPGGSYVYPWESPYLGKDATLFKESTLDVRERYAKYGFEAEMKGHFPEDHIAMMMQFLACLADESYEAFADGDDARVRELLGAQQAFVLAHVGEWLEALNEELYRKDESGVFFQIVESLRAFVACDVDFVGELVASGELEG